MKPTLHMAATELKRLFYSPTALLFLFLFEVGIAFYFFSYERFFARNIADLRPMFESMPLLLIVLVSAIAMRGWVEETRSGTIEHLLVLPLPLNTLVLGKYVSGLLLVCVALVGTFPLVATVWWFGNPDPMPIVCGYLGALLLASMYVAMGLCISATTDNQIVALLLTAILGGALYLVGTDAVTSLVGIQAAEVLRALGTGSRFDQLGRGILDLRVLIYFGAWTCTLLALNAYFLARRRLDLESPGGRKKHLRHLGWVLLIACNATLLVLWTTPATRLAIDVTTDRQHTLDAITHSTLDALEEPVVIRAFFSDQTHPKLGHLAPKINDMLKAYQDAGGPQVELSFSDPTQDDSVAQEIAEVYGIISRPVRVSERHRKSILNVYFQVLVEYGSNHLVIEMEDLVTIEKRGPSTEFKLANLEYTLTKGIRRLSQDFIRVDKALSLQDSPVEIISWRTTSAVPTTVSHVMETHDQVGRQFTHTFPEQVNYQIRELDSEETAKELFSQYGMQPAALHTAAEKAFYLHLLVVTEEGHAVIAPNSNQDQADLVRIVEQQIRETHPGYVKRIGLVTETPVQSTALPGEQAPPVIARDYRQLEALLGQEYVIERLELEDDPIASSIDLLIVAKPGVLSSNALDSVREYLGRGGSVLSLYGTKNVRLGNAGVAAKPSAPEWRGQLESWGVLTNNGLIFDPINARFPIPIIERDQGVLRQEVQEVSYPLFPEVRPREIRDAHPIIAHLEPFTVPWASPIRIGELPNGVVATPLFASSSGGEIYFGESLTPDYSSNPPSGFETDGVTGSWNLGVLLEGPFPKPDDPTSPDHRTVSKPGRLIAIGSSEFASDFVLKLSSEVQGEAHGGNVDFIKNTIDWATSDSAFIRIRSSGPYLRKLRPTDDRTKRWWEWGTYAVIATWLLVITLLPLSRRFQRDSIIAERQPK